MTGAGARVVAVTMAAGALLGVTACGSSSDDAAPSTGVSTSTAPASSSVAVPSADDDATETSTPPTLPPPYIDHADWVDTEVGPSLQIAPTDNGRRVSGDGTEDEAWSEVLRIAPDADTPGMKAQFDCHWTFARIVEPDKATWNIEPGRPVVTDQEMIAARCNPGFAEE
ncbi:MAG: DUF2599 domain-containing protein [Gordonia sp. (in: high G+C Gram-positive bacteria)]|uniref:DUF2599 domain-containing protein n=1 Tax=Gordonia sp. (in: high G+C Gram-positive bacteria) TaxID=84139 RepID=UPI0039E583A2